MYQFGFIYKKIPFLVGAGLPIIITIKFSP